MIVLMHLTTEEVALASTAIGGMIGFLGGGVRDRSSEHREHLKRLWEKESEIYESLLMESGSRQTQYVKARMAIKDGDGIQKSWKQLVENPHYDELEDRRLSARLTEFGRPEVREARERCNHHHAQFLAYIFMLGSIDPVMKKVKIADLEAVLDITDKAEVFLAEVVRDAIRTSPTTRKWNPSSLTVKKWLTLFR